MGVVLFALSFNFFQEEIVKKRYLKILLGCAALFFSASFVQASGEYDFTPLKIGILEVHKIHDADTTMEASLLPGLTEHPEFAGVFKRGPAPAVAQTFFFKSGSHNVLIDSGWGNELRIKGQTLATLKKIGISPDSITDILMTHLDMDHIGGLAENGKPVFPNATIWIAEPEANAWRQGKIVRRSEAAVKMAKDLWRAYGDHIKFFRYGDEILPGVKAVDATGHTPGHTAFDILSGNDKMTVAGDVLHIHQVQLQKPELSTTYDMDMEKAAETRSKLLDRATQEKSVFAGMHFPMASDVRARPDGGFMMREGR